MLFSCSHPLQVKCCACDVGMAVYIPPERGGATTEHGLPHLLCALCDGMLTTDPTYNHLEHIVASCPTTLFLYVPITHS